MSGILWPVAPGLRVTQRFGIPAHPWEPPMYLQRDAGGPRRCKPISFAGARKYPDVHPAIDIGCPIGTPILAVEDGKVVAAGVYSSTGEKYVMVRFHRDEKRQTIFFATHLSRVVCEVGERVTRGQKVALSGNSGMSTGPHLHFEIRVGSSDLDAWTSGGSQWFRYNPERLRVGGDMADADFIK